MSLSFRASRDFLLHSFLLLLALVFGYVKILDAGFMNWDDLDYVFNIKEINGGFSLEQIKNCFSKNFLGNFQPLPILSYAFDHTLAGANPFVFHLDSLLWHGLATILVYYFFTKLQRNKWLAFFVALFFAINPVQTESVSWIAARNKSMNAVFYLAAMVTYVSYVRQNKNSKLLWVTFFGLLAYLCKATALALPLALFAVDLWLRRPLNSPKVWLEKLPLILIGIPIAILTLNAQKEVTFLQHHSEFGWQNIVFAGSALTQYLFHLLFPFNLSVLYPYPKELSYWNYMQVLFAIVLCTFMVVAYRKRWYQWAGGILFFIVNLLPVLQLVQFGETLMADRYLYIACLGIWYPIVYHLFFFFKKSRFFRYRKFSIATIINCCVGIVFLIGTFIRNDIWLNEINFWNSILKRFPESSVAHYSIGGAYMKLNDIENAEIHMNQAVRYDPENYKAWRNKGVLHLRQGKKEQALSALDNSIKLYPYPKAYFTRALLYYDLQDFAKTILDINKVLELEPGDARAYYVRADCEEILGKPNVALRDYDKAVQLDPGEPLFLIRRGLLLAKLGDKIQAQADLNKAVALKPGDGETLYYRAIMRYNLGQDPCEDLKLAYRQGFKKAREAARKVCK